MKKILALILAMTTVLALTACGGSKEEESSAATETPKYESALNAATLITDKLNELPEDQRFPMGGGDSENTVMDAPGKFDVAKAEEMDSMLGLPAAEASKVDDAASFMHIMNSNTFTGAVYHVAEGNKAEDIANAVASNLAERQWICGMPDTLLVIDAGSGYIFTAFGADDIIQVVKTAAEEALEGSSVIIEKPIAE